MERTVLIALPSVGCPTAATLDNLSEFGLSEAWEGAQPTPSPTALYQMRALGRWLQHKLSPRQWAAFGMLSFDALESREINAMTLLLQHLRSGCVGKDEDAFRVAHHRCTSTVASRAQEAVVRQLTELSLSAATTATAHRTERELGQLFNLSATAGPAAPPASKKLSSVELVSRLIRTSSLRDLWVCELHSRLPLAIPILQPSTRSAYLSCGGETEEMEDLSSSASATAASPGSRLTRPALALPFASSRFLLQAAEWVTDSIYFAPTVLPGQRAAGRSLLSQVAALLAPSSYYGSSASCFLAADEATFLAVLAALRLRHPPAGYVGAGALLLLQSVGGSADATVSASWCPGAFPFAADGEPTVLSARLERLFAELPFSSFTDMINAALGESLRSGTPLTRRT
jgi:hypothetical protein